MNYKRYDDTIVLRLSPDEEIIQSINTVAQREEITLASISGLGAVKEIAGGLFDPVKKVYGAQEFIGYYEITSMVGNITTMNNQPYLHIHANWSDESCKTYGGHLTKGVISVTAEIFITILDGKIIRVPNETLGFNQMEFEEPFSI